MTKGKFGISLSIVAALAFVFTLLNYPTLVLLILGYALIAEKDEWLSRQTLQATFLTIVYSLVRTVLSLVYDFITFAINTICELFKLASYEAINVVGDIYNALTDILFVALIALTVWAVINVIRDKDAKLPLLSTLAEKCISID